MSDDEYAERFDLFIPYISDIPLCDQRETMERPFFSLAKRKRLKPIEYTSPNGEVLVNVQPHQDFGMATIWDADILIWAVSTLQGMKNDGVNDLPRTLQFHPYNLLKSIHRNTGGKEYQALRDSLGRLNSTVIQTNIRAKDSKKLRQFHWIESWSEIQTEDGKNTKGMSITLAEWVYEGIIMEGGVLSINPEYFNIKGGRERWLYRVARKHAGGAGAGGFKISRHCPIGCAMITHNGNNRRQRTQLPCPPPCVALPDFNHIAGQLQRQCNIGRAFMFGQNIDKRRIIALRLYLKQDIRLRRAQRLVNKAALHDLRQI